MNDRVLALIASLGVLPPIAAQEATAPQKPNAYAADTRSQALETAKKEQDASLLARLDKRSKGRKIQEAGQTLIDGTEEINDLLFHAPLVIRQQHATAFVAIMNRIVTGIGLGIRAFGRRKEALQAITSTNEQILEAATQSFEKIESLSSKLEELIGPKTVGRAVQENQTSDSNKSRKLLNLLSPSNYLNTFNNFTDDLYITDNKSSRWEKIRQTSKELKEEQDRFDDYVALLQIKFLEKLIMNLHLEENKDKYIVTLQDSVTTLDAAINATSQKIEDLSNKPLVKNNLLNIIKKKLGADQETKNSNLHASLNEEKNKYIKQKEDILKDIKYYQEKDVNLEFIATIREELKNRIADIKTARVSKTNTEDLNSEIDRLKDKLQNLQIEVEDLKKSLQ